MRLRAADVRVQIQRMLAAIRPRLPLVLLGAIAALGLEPFGLAPVTVLALGVGLWRCMRAANVRAVMADGAALASGYFTVAMHWIVFPFLVAPLATGWMAPFALLLMVAGLALFWAVPLGLAWRLGRGLAGRMVWAALLLTVADLLRAHVLTGFPWAVVGQVWAGWGLGQAAALVGMHGLTLVTLLAVALAAGLGQRKGWLLGIGVSAVLLLAGEGAGRWSMARPLADAGPVVRLVQPNVPQSEKWNPERGREFLDRLLMLTRSPLGAEGDPEVVIWPETAVQPLLGNSVNTRAVIARAAGGRPVLLGMNRREGARFFNAMVLLDSAGAVSAVYDKSHLVPFGEYLPLGEWLKAFGLHGLAASEGGGYTAGPAGGSLEVPVLGRARPLICYEGIFPEEISASNLRAMVLITNDAWFGPSAGPRQHLAQARLRAIEQGVPMIRVANTGVTAMIDPYGRIVGEIGMGQQGVIDVAVPAALGWVPPYARLGDWLVLAFITVGIILLLAANARKMIDQRREAP